MSFQDEGEKANQDMGSYPMGSPVKYGAGSQVVFSDPESGLNLPESAVMGKDFGCFEERMIRDDAEKTVPFFFSRNRLSAQSNASS